MTWEIIVWTVFIIVASMAATIYCIWSVIDYATKYSEYLEDLEAYEYGWKPRD